MLHLSLKEKRKRDDRTSGRAVWRARKSSLGQKTRGKRKMKKTMVRIFLALFFIHFYTSAYESVLFGFMSNSLLRFGLMLKLSSTPGGPDLVQLPGGQRHGVPRLTQGT